MKKFCGIFIPQKQYTDQNRSGEVSERWGIPDRKGGSYKNSSWLGHMVTTQFDS